MTRMMFAAALAVPMLVAPMLVAPMLVAAPVQAQTTANAPRMTASGSIIHGSPSARVKLVEWFSMTCPSCARFSGAASAELDRRVRAGTTSVEYRHFVLNPLDFAASLMARCGGAARFQGNARALFATQQEWAERGHAWMQANPDVMTDQNLTRRLQRFARGAGLYERMGTRGYTPAQLDRCIADPAEQKRLVAMTTEANATIQATPSFAINGTVVQDVHDWAGLAPRLTAAGAR